MKVITTHNGAQGGASTTIKPFTWSYSRLKNFEACPKKHWHVDIAKDVKEEEGEALLWGNQVHKAAAARLKDGKALPPGMEIIESFCQKILTPAGNAESKILVEQKLAITKDFGPCGYFDKSVWFRAVGDVIKIVGPVALIGDWKTGKIKEDGVQLALSAMCVFAHYPEVKRVRSEFIWVAHDATSRADFNRNDMPQFWQGVWTRIQALEHAHNTQSYPAKPGGLCRNWCPVTKCPHHGE